MFINSISSAKLTTDIETNLSHENSYIDNIISLGEDLKTKKKLSESTFNDIYKLSQTEVKKELNTSNTNLNDIDKIIIARSLLNLFLFLYFVCLVIAGFVCYYYKKENGVLTVSVLILLNLPLIVFISAINSSFFFVSADLCDSTYNAIYTNEMPVYNKGIGWFANCHSGKTRNLLYMINDNLYSIYKTDIETYNGNKEGALLEEIKKIIDIKNNNLDPLITCDALYRNLISLEANMCKNGPAYSFKIFELYFWLFLSVIILFWGFNRLVPVVSRKTKEINEKLLAEESAY